MIDTSVINIIIVVINVKVVINIILLINVIIPGQDYNEKRTLLSSVR